MGDEELSVTLLLETESLRSHDLKSVENMLEKTNAKIELVVVNNDKTEADGLSTGHSLSFSWQDLQLLFELIKDRKWSLLYKAEIKIAGMLGDPYVQEWSKTWDKNSVWDLEKIGDPDVITYDPLYVESGLGIELPDDVIDEIVDKTDIVVNFEHDILTGDILTRPQFGVFSFHGGDSRRYRGRPGGFWQFLNEEDRIGVTLQQLTDDLDGGKIVEIRTADISDCNTYSEMKCRQVKLHAKMLPSGIKKIQKDSFEPEKLNEPGELTHSTDEDVFKNSLKMLIKNIMGRVLKNKFYFYRNNSR
jgi:hypothetical protein